MNIDNKLDEDFLFYLSFTGGYYNRIQPETDVEKCQVLFENGNSYFINFILKIFLSNG